MLFKNLLAGFFRSFCALLFVCSSLFASKVDTLYYADYEIDPYYNFVGIHKVPDELVNLISVYRLIYIEDQLSEIAYLSKGKLSHYQEKLARIVFEHPEEDVLECIFFTKYNQRTTLGNAAKWRIEYPGIVIRRKFLDLQGGLIENGEGVFQYVYQLDDEGRISNRFNKNKLYKNILDDSDIYERRYKYDRNNNLAEVSFWNKDGSRFHSWEKGYSIESIRFDSLGNAIETRYYDENKLPFLNSSCNCFSKLRKTNSLGYETEVRFLDTNYTLIVDAAYGAAIVKSVYNENFQFVSESYFAIDSSRVARKSFGFAKAVNFYDKKGRLVRTNYLNENLQLVNMRDGFASRVIEYDDKENLVTEYLKNKDGELVLYDSKELFYKVVSKRSQESGSELEYYLDQDNKLIQPNGLGYYKILKTYNSYGQVASIEYMDEFNNSIETTDGVAWEENTYDLYNYTESTKRYNLEAKLVADSAAGVAYVINNNSRTGKVMTQKYFDKNNLPAQKGKNGYHEVKTEIEIIDGLEYAIQSFYDTAGMLCITPRNSYARAIDIYGLHGLLIESRFEDIDGNLIVPFRNQYAIMKNEFDGNNNFIKKTFYNSQLEISNNIEDSTSYASLIYEYDKNGHSYLMQKFDADGNLIEERYEPEDGNLFGLHDFKLIFFQRFYATTIFIVIVLFFILRKKVPLFSGNKIVINVFIWFSLILVFVGLLLLRNNPSKYEQALVFWVVNFYPILILLTSVINRKIIGFIVIPVFLLGCALLYIETLGNYRYFKFLWIVFCTPILALIIACFIPNKLNPKITIATSLLIPAALTILLFTWRNPYRGNMIRYWNDGKINENDFLGSFESESNNSAAIRSYISVNYNCTKGRFEFKTSAKMDRFNSWKKESMSEYLLNHEQRHFDITRIYADRLKLRLQELNSPCELEEQVLSEEINRLVNEVSEELDREQDRYDFETEHGLFPKNQKIWNKDIDNRLSSIRNL